MTHSEIKTLDLLMSYNLKKYLSEDERDLVLGIGRRLKVHGSYNTKLTRSESSALDTLLAKLAAKEFLEVYEDLL